MSGLLTPGKVVLEGLPTPPGGKNSSFKFSFQFGEGFRIGEQKQFRFLFRFAGARPPLPKLLPLPDQRRGLLSVDRQVLLYPQTLTATLLLRAFRRFQIPMPLFSPLAGQF